MQIKKSALALAAIGIIGALTLVGRGQVDPQGAAPAGAAAVVVMNQPAVQTKIEAMLATRGVVIVRGYTDIGSVPGEDDSSFSVAAIELTDVSRGQKEYGLAVGVRQRSGGTVVTYVDFDELDAVTGGMDYLSKMDSTSTQLAGYEGRLKTKGDLEVANFADANGTRMVSVKGMQVLPETGQVAFASAYFPLARMGDLKQLVATARQTMEKAKGATR